MATIYDPLFPNSQYPTRKNETNFRKCTFPSRKRKKINTPFLQHVNPSEEKKKSPDWLIPILCQCAKTKKNTSGLPVSRVLTVYAARRSRFAQGVVLDLSNGHTTAGWHPRKRIRLRRFCTYATDSHHQKGCADGCCVAHLAVC